MIEPFIAVNGTMHPLKNNAAITSDGSNYVRSSMFDRLKPKIGGSSSINNRKTCLSSFDVR